MPTIRMKSYRMRTFPLAAACLLAAAGTLAAQPTRPKQPADSQPRSLAASLARFGAGLVGTPYVSGGETTQGVDCSGLVSLVYRKTAGIALPDSVGALFVLGSNA